MSKEITYHGFLSRVTFATEGSIIALSASMLVLCSCTVALKFYVRNVQRVGLWIDDWLTLPALLSSHLLTLCILLIDPDNVIVGYVYRNGNLYNYW
jgi:hypothetical protein